MEIDERLDAVLEAVYRNMQVYCIAANAGAALSGVAMPMEQPRPTFDPVEFGRDLKWGAGWAAWYAAAEELP